MHPKISVVMPVYNAEKNLVEALESILTQTFTDFELIAVNDSSTDATVSIIQDFAKRDSRIILVDNKFEKGLPGALNTGLEIAKGEYLARADGDDILRLYRFQTQVSFLEKHPNINIVGGGYKTFGKGNSREIFHPCESLEIARKFLTDTYFCHPTVMFRRSILKTVSGYPQVACEDFAFFSKVLRVHRGCNIKKILVDYREHETNYSTSHREKIAESVYRTFEDNYQFYTGTRTGLKEYFSFKTKRILHLGNLVMIAKTEIRILKKIRLTYGISTFSRQNFTSLFNFKKEVIIALLLTIKHGNH